MRPARGLLLVRPIEPEETYAGGAIIVPEAARQRLTINQCECVAVGEPEFCDDEDCDRHEVWATWALTGDVNRSDEEALAQRYHGCPVKPGDWLLMRLVAAETRISHTTARAVRGPQAAGVEQIENVTEGAIPTVRASMGVMLANIARTGLVKARTGFANDVSDDLALLFSKGLQDPDELRALLFSLEHVQGKLAQRAGVGSRAAAAIGEMVGGVR